MTKIQPMDNNVVTVDMNTQQQVRHQDANTHEVLETEMNLKERTINLPSAFIEISNMDKLDELSDGHIKETSLAGRITASPKVMNNPEEEEKFEIHDGTKRRHTKLHLLDSVPSSKAKQSERNSDD